MSARRVRRWPTLGIAAAIAAVVGATGGCSDFFCTEEEPTEVFIEDGTYQGEGSGVRPRLTDVTATIEGEELTVQYVQDTDGRTYRVRLREVTEP
jgi:hypothetical protein